MLTVLHIELTTYRSMPDELAHCYIYIYICDTYNSAGEDWPFYGVVDVDHVDVPTALSRFSGDLTYLGADCVFRVQLLCHSILNRSTHRYSSQQPRKNKSMP